MPMYPPDNVPYGEAQQLRSQGMNDDVIVEELMRKGYTPDQVSTALSQDEMPTAPPMAAAPSFQRAMPRGDDSIYERIEEIAEGMIDEKWDDLLAEVKKIVEWKERLEEKQSKLQHDVDALKENFGVLHQGVLGKLEEYDTRMRDVGTELGAVGKVFKDVIPEFVENVKELSAVTKGMRKK